MARFQGDGDSAGLGVEVRKVIIIPDLQVSVVRNAGDKSPTTDSFRRLIAEIVEGSWVHQVIAVRKAYEKGGKDEAAGPKRQLPAVLWSGVFEGGRKAEHLKKRTGLICVDLDELGARLPSVREAIERDPHTVVCFVSPTGSGLKVIFKCESAEHIQAYWAAERYILQNYGLEIDPACKDVNRLCFVSYDPETFIAETAIPLPILPERKEFSTPASVRTPLAPATGGIEPWDDYDLRADLPSLLREYGWTEQGQYGWTRPGKTSGISATWNKVPGRFFVFTSSTEFEANHTYRPWHVYAILKHGGNWSMAVAALRAEGYGAPKTSRALPKQASGPEIYDPGYEEPTRNGAESHVPDEIKTETAKSFTLWAPSKFISHVPDPSSVLLGTGYLELGQWTSFIGIGGLGKTRLALWLVICQMLKKAWCGIPTGGVPQKAIILSTENGLRRWKEDLSKVMSTLSEDEQAVVEANLRIMAMTDDEDGDICLGNLLNVARLQVTLRVAAAGIVVLDPFADLMDGDENKTVDLVATLTLLRSITRSCCPKAAILIIHHGRTGSANVAQAGDNFNAGNFGRGAKALFSKVRCELQLAPEDRDNPNRLVLACGKANDTVKFAPRCIVFNPDNFTYRIDPNFDIDAWRADVTGNRKKSSVSIADLVNAVHEKCPVAGDEIATSEIFEEFEASGVTKRTLQRLVASAIEEGYIRIGKKRFMLRLGSKPLPRD